MTDDMNREEGRGAAPESPSGDNQEFMRRRTRRRARRPGNFTPGGESPEADASRGDERSAPPQAEARPAPAESGAPGFSRDRVEGREDERRPRRESRGEDRPFRREGGGDERPAREGTPPERGESFESRAERAPAEPRADGDSAEGTRPPRERRRRGGRGRGGRSRRSAGEGGAPGEPRPDRDAGAPAVETGDAVVAEAVSAPPESSPGEDTGAAMGDRSGGERAGGDREGRPRGPRGEDGRGERRERGGRGRGGRDRPAGDRPVGDRLVGDRAAGDRPVGDRPVGDRPEGDRRRGDGPRGERRERSGARPDRERPNGLRGDAPRAGDDNGRGARGRGRPGDGARGGPRGVTGSGTRRFDRGAPRSQTPMISAVSGRPMRPTDAIQLPPKPVRVLIAGGGTGGHVVPAVAIAEALRRRNPESKIVIVGSNRGIEAEIVPQAGFDLVELPVRSIPRRPTPAAVPAAFSMVRAGFRMMGLIREMDAQVVVGTGGYVSFAAIVAARILRRPTLLQEQNSVPGRANRFLARFAREIHIHFTEARRHFRDRGKLRLSGNPVRVKIAEGRVAKVLQKYRLFNDRRTVLILGGSQGAHALNEAFQGMLTHFRGDRGVQFVIQTGKGDYQAVLDSVRNSGCRVVVKSFIKEIDELYGVANLVVARAGAMTLAELAAFGLPSILVPYPYAADDHQTANARAMAEKDAAVLLPERELSGDRLAQEIRRLLDDGSGLRRMGMHAFALSRPDAARHIAEAIERLGGAGPESVLHTPEEFEALEAAGEAK